MSVNLFDKFVLSDADAQALQAQYDEIGVLKSQVGEILNDIQKKERAAWLFIRNIYPDLLSCEVRFDFPTKTIIVISLTP